MLNENKDRVITPKMIDQFLELEENTPIRINDEPLSNKNLDQFRSAVRAVLRNVDIDPDYIDEALDQIELIHIECIDPIIKEIE